MCRLLGEAGKCRYRGQEWRCVDSWERQGNAGTGGRSEGVSTPGRGREMQVQGACRSGGVSTPVRGREMQVHGAGVEVCRLLGEAGKCRYRGQE